jgi:hypothetical protein
MELSDEGTARGRSPHAAVGATWGLGFMAARSQCVSLDSPLVQPINVCGDSVRVGEEESRARPGLVVRVAAGEDHSYENRGTEELRLISVNVPAK